MSKFNNKETHPNYLSQNDTQSFCSAESLKSEGTRARHAEFISARISPSSDTSCHLLPPMGRRQFGFAFTLAEVLITLGIIGVVAAITIPVVTAKIQEKILINQAKKAYSLITNTVNKWCYDNGSIGDYSAFWLSVDNTNIDENYYELLKELTNEMNVVEICNNADINKNKCGGDYITDAEFYNKGNRSVSLSITRAVLNNGMIISLSNNTKTSKSCINTDTNGAKSDVCGFIVFDVNGAKGPNKSGYDYFEIAYQPQKYSSRWFTRGNLEYAIINDKLQPKN